MNEAPASLLTMPAFMHHADPVGVYQHLRVAMMLKYSHDEWIVLLHIPPSSTPHTIHHCI